MSDPDRKIALLIQIQQQRLDLSRATREWQRVTAPYDRGWQTLLQFRRYLLLASGIFALWSSRRPRRLMQITRKGLSLWSTWRMVRSTLGKVRF